VGLVDAKGFRAAIMQTKDAREAALAGGAGAAVAAAPAQHSMRQQQYQQPTASSDGALLEIVKGLAASVTNIEQFMSLKAEQPPQQPSVSQAETGAGVALDVEAQGPEL